MMPKILPLPTSRLHATFDPERIPWQDSREIPLPRNGAGSRNAFQPRAMQALDMALNIRACGYNVYVSGDANLGRSYTLLSYLGRIWSRSTTAMTPTGRVCFPCLPVRARSSSSA